MTADRRPLGAFDDSDDERVGSGNRRNAALGSDPAWRRLGLAALLGLVAGATLFATEAQGRDAARHRLARGGRPVRPVRASPAARPA